MRRFLAAATVAVLLAACAAPAAADSPPLPTLAPPGLRYDLVFGGVANIEAGAITTIGATSLAFDQVSLRLYASPLDNVGTRLANLLGVQIYLGVMMYGSFAHEFFGHYGHGIRYGLSPHMGLDFPAIGGSTEFTTTYRTPALQRQIDAAAGPEVTATIAYEATAAMYSGRPVGSYEGLYLIGGHLVDSYLYDQNALQPFLRDPTTYLNQPGNPRPVPNDPVAWALALTERYGFYRGGVIPTGATWVYAPPDARVYLNNFIRDQGKRVTRAFVLQLFDPALLNGLYGIGRYLVTGDPYFQPVMIGRDALRVAPSIRANLGYLGAESYFDVFVVARGLPPFSAYVRIGGNMFHEQDGGGVAFRELRLGPDVELAGQIDGWYDDLSGQVGANVEHRITLRMSPSIGVIEALGYKTLGGLMGRPTEAGPYGYVGLRILLPQP